MDELRKQLSLSEAELPEHETSAALVALVKNAIKDTQPRHDLNQIAQALSATKTTPEVDALEIVPLLLVCDRSGVLNLLDVLSKNSIAREIIIAVQEGVERLKNQLVFEYSNEDADDDKVESSEDSEVTPAEQLIRVFRLYAGAISRLKKGKKRASETLQLHLSEFEVALSLVSQHASIDEARQLVNAVADISQSSFSWVEEETDKPQVTSVLFNFISCALTSCASRLQAKLAQQAFQQYFSRFVISSQKETLTAPDPPLGKIYDVLRKLNIDPTSLQIQPTHTTLILLAHTPSYIPTFPALQILTPVFLSSFKSGTTIDESLYLLITGISALPSNSSAYPSTTPQDIFYIELMTVLPIVASAHPDSQTRHIVFRLVGLVLEKMCPEWRMHHLKELLVDDDDEISSPQMRIAAVGLVKNAVLEALRSSEPNVFTRPQFTEVFSGLIFRAYLPKPEEIQENQDLEDWLESPEPLRLVESLGLYYVLLRRDTENKTGIRDIEKLNTVKKDLLIPLRTHLMLCKERVGDVRPQDRAMQWDILEASLSNAERATEDIREVLGA